LDSKGGWSVSFAYFKVIKAPKFFVAGLIVLAGIAFIVIHHIAACLYYKDINVISWSVANKVIVVDPGHGGIDPGAVGALGTLEKDINLAIAKRLSLVLSQAGAVVVMTREDDSCYSSRKKEDLDARIALTEKHKADIFLSIQGNALKSSKWSGAQTFYYPRFEESKKLAVSIQDELGRILKNTKRLARPHTEAYILRQLQMPAVVIEVGFMSNPQEERLLNDTYYQGKAAWAIYAGVVKYLAGDKK
jgi:N-acetylmuramoyl-L-alanine amidase